ncbi:RNA ligase family protein [Haloarchaeobius sp. HME9146]|uniref:RNA ligase family protein n=1 Tax=Haloarchaeobius sp. HME9146 TaxID=2978732 RepID=UPI0021C090B8|nr:RNA ligase family protein [Haloarchaeobius sp. HME9146]MCT9096421.1 RNA ligase family protein [Haloarchaeobius sp. HME9146]
MHPYPPIPDAADAPDELFDQGHLWLTEKLDGAHLRLTLRDTGVLAFGDRNRDWPDDQVPEEYRHAVRHVRETVDRAALQDAVDSAGDLVVYGVAMHRQTIDYDWDRVPSFVGFDVWRADRDAFLPPDIAEKVVEGIGLASVNTFDREVPAKHFDPEGYEVPDSAWYDGPAAGVVVKNKRGLRAAIESDRVDLQEGPTPVDASAEEFAERVVTEGMVRRIVRDLTDRAGGSPPRPEAIHQRAVDRVFRAEYGRITHHESPVDPAAVTSAVAGRVHSLFQRIDST